MANKHIFIFIIIYFTLSLNALSQVFSLSGIISDKKTKKSIEFATIAIKEQALWGISDTKGKFTIKQIPKGKIYVTASCLGYVKQTIEIDITTDLCNFEIYLLRDNLALDEVVVTAHKTQDKLNSNYTIDRNSLNHLQMVNVTDVASLLPGGQTNKHLTLTSASYIALRSESRVEKGNPSFGTAIEVDGVRLNNNQSFSDKIKGADIRNVSSSNIESIEIVTGVPSAEHGDLENGMIKINTRKGKSPYIVELFSNINTRQASVNKGFNLKKDRGIVNASFEHAKSVREIMSPYTSYQRNVLTLNYSKQIKNRGENPILLSAGVTGNIGGYDSKSDPDAFANTFEKQKHNSIRGKLKLKYLANKSWITNVSFFASATYSNKLYTLQKRESSSSSRASIHGKEEGYFVGENYNNNPNAHIIMVEPGYWYEKQYNDSKPIHTKVKLKANLFRKIGKIKSQSKIGADFTNSGDLGKGTYFDELKYAPTWRSYNYNQVPFTNNLAIFVEEKFILKWADKHKIQLQAGVRSDNTWIKQSAYGTVSSWSPRLNAKYSRNFYNKAIKKINIYAGWGQTVKLPSFYVLHPRQVYSDRLIFAPGTQDDGTTFYGYHTMPSKKIYNPNLEWQKSSLAEIGFDFKINNIFFSLSAYYRKTHNPFAQKRIYTPFSYKFTSEKELEGCPIPQKNRHYSIDRQTGIVTVSDISGKYASQQLDYRVLNDFMYNYTHENNTPLHRFGIEWVLDFGKIKALNTSFRIDGNYYRYKGTNENIQASIPAGTMTNGKPYKYIAFYVGGNKLSNGDLNKIAKTNFTVTTHIPKIRLIMSVRIETMLYRTEQFISEYNGKQRGFVLDDNKDFFPSETKTDIYAENQYVAIYPDYYISFDDMQTKIPFAEKFAWAKEHDKALFNDLAKMVEKTSYLNSFGEDKSSMFFSANINITKEIGDIASISFNAKNFFNSMGTVTHSRYNRKTSLYDSSEIPNFYYGLTVRLKL